MATPTPAERSLRRLRWAVGVLSAVVVLLGFFTVRATVVLWEDTVVLFEDLEFWKGVGRCAASHAQHMRQRDAASAWFDLAGSRVEHGDLERSREYMAEYRAAGAWADTLATITDSLCSVPGVRDLLWPLRGREDGRRLLEAQFQAIEAEAP